MYDRINRRVEIMFEQGLVDEVKTLLDSGVNPQCQAFKGIGYKEVIQYLEGLISYDACVDLIQKIRAILQNGRLRGTNVCRI